MVEWARKNRAGIARGLLTSNQGPRTAPVKPAYKSVTLREGDQVELKINAVDADGIGLASIADVAYHVAGAFPTERVHARVTHVSRQRPVIQTVTVEVLHGHRDRRPATCRHHESHAGGSCTGCPLMPLKADGQRDLKRERLAALGMPVSATPDGWVDGEQGEFGYRWSSKRVASGTPGRLVLGSFIRGSHRIADMTDCLVEHPRIQTTAQQLQQLGNALRIAGYDETTKTGDLRYVWFKTNGAEVLVTLIAATEITPALRTLAEQLTTAVGVSGSVQSDSGNRVRGDEVVALRGKQSITLDLAGVALEVGPLGFLQPNPTVAARAYVDLCHDALGNDLTGALAVDAYAGAGATTHLLRQRYAEVIANDLDPQSADRLGVKAKSAAELLADLKANGRTPDLILCNPPRSGLGPDVCKLLVEIAPPRIHIMSCNPETHARDLTLLHEHYVNEATRAYNTLPQTSHVEVVTWLVRK